MKYYNAEKFWDTLLSSRFDLTGVGHGAYGSLYNQYLYRAKQRAFEKALKRCSLSIQGKSVLDIGCGIGFFTAIANQLHCQSYTGFDITPTVIERLQEAYPDNTFRQVDIGAELQSDLLTPGVFDFVFCIDVIYHLVDPERFEQALTNIWSFVKPGGVLLLVDSYWKEDLIPGGVIEEIRPDYVPHVCFHKYKDYQKHLFENHDCQVIDFIPMYYLFNRPIVGTSFPWRYERISWHLRYKLFEWRPMLKLMYFLDGIMVDRIRFNPSLKILVARKTE